MVQLKLRPATFVAESWYNPAVTEVPVDSVDPTWVCLDHNFLGLLDHDHAKLSQVWTSNEDFMPFRKKTLRRSPLVDPAEPGTREHGEL